MSRARTVLGVALAVLAIAWFVRVPVTEADFGPRPSPAEAVPGPSDTPPSPTPTPGATPPSGDAPRRNVAALDPTTLAVQAASLTTVGEGFLSTAPDTALVLADPREDAGGALLRIVAAPGADGDPPTPDIWRVERGEVIADLAWFGERDGVVAWITVAGVIRIQRLGSTGAYQTMTLPPGRRAVDARLLDGDRLAILTRPSLEEGPVLIVMDVAAHVTFVDVAVGLSLGAGGGEVAHAWDVARDRLVVADPATDLLTAVSLADGSVRQVDLPQPSHRESQRRAGTVLTVDAAAGRIVVSGVDRVMQEGGQTWPRAWGVAWFDDELSLRANRQDGESVFAALLPHGRVLATQQSGGAAVLDTALQQLATVVPDLAVVGVFSDEGRAQLLTAPLEGCQADAGGEACAPTGLVALDASSGAVLAQRALSGPDVRWLPQAGLLVSDEPPR